MKFKKTASFLLALTLVSSNFPYHATVKAEGIKKEAIVTFKDSYNSSSTIKALGGNVVYRFKHMNAVVVDMPEVSLQSLQNNKNITNVSYDEKVHFYGQVTGYGINSVKAPQAWAQKYTGKGVKVAVFDTGVATHPDVKVTGRITWGGEYYGIPNDQFPEDYEGHGTHVAGIISAENNSFGMVGVAPDSDIYSVQIVGLVDLAKGLDWAIDKHIDVVNMSLGYANDIYPIKVMIDKATASGMTIVASAGNEGNAEGTGDSVGYPAKYENVISVGSVDEQNRRSFFSSTGKVDLTAPGSNVYSTVPEDSSPSGYEYMSGTSMSAPHVTAIFALYKQAYPTLTNSQIRALVEKNALDLGTAGKDTLFGYGLAQAPLTGIVPTYSSTQIPSDFKASEQNGYGLELTWDPTIDAYDYIVQRDGVEVYHGENYQYIDTTATEGTHNYTLIAVSSNGQSTPTTISVNVKKFYQVPADFIDVKTKATDTSVTISWSGISNADKYIILKNGSKVYEGTSLFFTERNLKPNSYYSYLLYAENENGENVGIPIIAQTDVPKLASSPRGFKAKTTTKGVLLSWNPMNYVASYTIVRFDGKFKKVIHADALETSYLDTTVVSGKTYTYSIVGKNHHGNSPSSKIKVKIPAKGKTYTGIYPNKSIYKKGEKISITTIVNKGYKSPVEKAKVYLYLVNSKKHKTLIKSLYTDKTGKANVTYTISKKAASGYYTIKVITTHPSLKGSTGFTKIRIK